MTSEIVDLKQQLIGLFEKEDVLAFFDFRLSLGADAPVQGLCKISAPKAGAAKSNYLSLLFIVDAVDDSLEAKVDAYMKHVLWQKLKDHLRGIDMIVPMPHVRYGMRHYLKEVELYLAAHTQITGALVSGDLYRAILLTLGCEGGEPVLWSDLPPEKQRLESLKADTGTNRSLIAMIGSYFKR